ncbi:hypothetical protein B0H19DRAFT_122909 [Mycena capillaripes]|nr:hypothetical protein B0H19DRAFT_122909 [Mycena capillaripes]
MIPLPQELLDAIVDEVDDSTTLKSCSLVATSFLLSSQHNLFRTFWLRGCSSQKAAVFLTESPHLASYIHDLTVEIWDTTDTSSNLTAVEVTLRLVQNIECLTMSGRSKEWSDLGHEVSSALFDCLSRPSIRRLDLVRMKRVPTALILASTAIPVVSFSRVVMDSEEEISEHMHDSAPTPRLRRLLLPTADPEILRICDTLVHSKKPSYIEQVERLDIRISSESATYDERLLTACAKTLNYPALELGDHIRIPQLPLVLQLEMKVFVGIDKRLPPFFNSNFSQIASSLPLVETITLVFVTNVRLFPEMAWPDQGPLPILGPSFANRVQLLHLRRVHCRLLRLSTSPSLNVLFDRFVPAMESKMPRLQGTGILKCTLG